MAGVVYFTIDGIGSFFESVGTLPLDRLTRGQQKAAIKAALDATMQWWIAEYLPLRFTPAATRFGYDPAGGTMAKKIRQSRKPGWSQAALPNVWTGATRSAAQGARFRSAGTPEHMKGRLIMRLPGYVNRQPSQLTNRVVRNISPKELQPLWARFRLILSEIVRGASPERLAEVATSRRTESRYPMKTRSIAAPQRES